MNDLHFARGIDHRREIVARLPSPCDMRRRVPASRRGQELVLRSRRQLLDILSGCDDRLFAVVGPCSVHDPAAALAYAERLAALAEAVADRLVVVMRVYVEKPRTRVGWTGLVGDPRLDGSSDLEAGLRQSRRLMTEVLDLGLPVACEFLDPLIALYLADLVAWGSVGARTTQSQPHRHLASGLSMPMGIKNPTSGRLEDAVDAIVSASCGHVIPGIDDQGHAAVVSTAGNPDCHVVLRGSVDGPNYSAFDVARTLHLLGQAGLPRRVVIDASHGNSFKDCERQQAVVGELARRIAHGERGIAGVMVESFLVGGRQDLLQAGGLVFGQSVTDACSGWPETVEMLDHLAGAVAERRVEDLTAGAA